MKCAFCEGQIYIDKSGAGFFYILPFQLNEAAARGVFKRWTASSHTAKDLEATAQVTSFKASFFPVFMFRRDTGRGEQVIVWPARSTTLPGLHSLMVPQGDLKVFDQSFDHGGSELIEPNIEMTAYMDQLPGRPKEQALVYFPIYLIEYTHRDHRYQVIIEGSSGKIYSADFPPRMAAGYYLLGVGGLIACGYAGLVALESPVTAAIVLALTIPALMYAGYYVAKNM